MKNIYSILLCIGLVAGFVACEKDKEFALTTLSINNEVITPAYNSADVRCSFKTDATISDAYVQYALSLSYAKYEVAKMTEEKGIYTAQLVGLADNTTYYIRYAVSNKYSSVVSEEVIEFQTLQCTVPTVVLDSIADVWDNRAKAYLHLTFDGGASVTDMGICWSKHANPTIEDIHKSTKDTVAVLDMTDLQPSTTYYVRAYATNEKGTAYGEQVSFTTKEQSSTPNDGTENGHEYVDLGVSVKWASCNVGANKPEDYGDYFAWGETTTKDTYDWSTYKYCNGSYSTLTKYCNKSSYGNNGFTDNKTQLELSDDAARANWGGNWRMPTDAEWTELCENCTWTWTTQNGVNGYKVTSNKNGNSIFLPAAGYRRGSSLDYAGSSGDYWSSSVELMYDPYYAYQLYFDSSYMNRSQYYRYRGQSVRPVLGETTIPTVTTTIPTQITEMTAVAGGNVTSDSNASVTERGVVYSTSQNPTTENNKVPNGSGTGEFTCNLTGLQANTTYYVRAYAVNNKGTAYGEQVSFTTKEQSSTPNNGTENGYGYVDLGLSVKWATCNVGASKPEEYGDYFAWGETQPKDTYDWSTYKWCNGSSHTLTKYCTDNNYGTVDNKTVLDAADDAATANWGGSWRMPTDAELTELRENCTWTWIIENDMCGYRVTSKKENYTDKSIFLPVTRNNGALYWSSSLGSNDPDYACDLYFDVTWVGFSSLTREYGRSVRPVLGESVVETTIPTVTTSAVSQITETTAEAGGNVTADGNASVTERGVCIATVSNPTTSKTKITAGSGTGSFTCNLTGLQANTTYYVRAYAINSKGIAYGEEVSFTTKEEMVDNPPSNLVAMPFSVSATKQVTFSPGNLQYTQSTNTWSFASAQWEMLGTDNVTGGSVSSDPTYGDEKYGTDLADKVDLFGWSTSTMNFGVSISTDDYSGSFVDWGTNTIGNDAPNTWRTLSYDEWAYLQWNRTNANDLYGVAQVNGVNGLIFLPDNWTCPAGVTFKSGLHSSQGVDYYAAHQIFTADQWSKLESAGAVFLPAAGYRGCFIVHEVQYRGEYWSATENDSDYAYDLYFGSSGVFMSGDHRYDGHPVRLVKDL